MVWPVAPFELPPVNYPVFEGPCLVFFLQLRHNGCVYILYYKLVRGEVLT